MPVRWEESVRELTEEGVNTFVEVGPSRVLTGLLRHGPAGDQMAGWPATMRVWLPIAAREAAAQQ